MTRPITYPLMLTAAFSAASCDDLRSPDPLDIPVDASQSVPNALRTRTMAIVADAPPNPNDVLRALHQTLAPSTPPAHQAMALERDSDGTWVAALVFDAVPDDDSVSGWRYDLTMTLDDDGSISLERFNESWRCWPERGSQTFGTEPCS